VKPLTSTMLDCLDYCRTNGGSIHRHPGGFWGALAFERFASYGTSTVEALVRRGELEYTEWKERKFGPFPITAAIKQQPDDSTGEQSNDR
jgi:hypothetical protein